MFEIEGEEYLKFYRGTGLRAFERRINEDRGRLEGGDIYFNVSENFTESYYSRRGSDIPIVLEAVIPLEADLEEKLGMEKYLGNYEFTAKKFPLKWVKGYRGVEAGDVVENVEEDEKDPELIRKILGSLGMKDEKISDVFPTGHRYDPEFRP